MKKMTVTDFAFPFLILILSTLVFRFTDLDVAIERLFYSPERGWFLGQSNPWLFLYNYGNIPSLFVAFCALFILAFGFFSRKVTPLRKMSLFLLLFLLIGPGLITNVILKEHWGRPRPKQVQTLGGGEPFLPVLAKGVAGARKSFPSGHASVGYFLMAPFFLLRKRARGWAWMFLLLGLAYGTLMGIGRMIQGAHFPSDIVWAWGVTYMTGLVLYYLLRLEKTPWWGGDRSGAEPPRP